jgi:hypothetical protein
MTSADIILRLVAAAAIGSSIGLNRFAHHAELEAARDGAMGTGQFSAAVSATMGKARLHGLIKPNDATPLVPASAPAPVINVILSSDKP